jgi:hypothetical protein
MTAALPPSSRPVPCFPGYAIERDGTVWRLAPSHLDARYGPVPRRVKPLMMGSVGRKSPAVKLTINGVPFSRTVRSLVRQAWEE